MARIEDPEGREVRVMHELLSFRDKRLLEIGCGHGRATWRIAEDAASVLAVDPDAESIESARASLPQKYRSKVSFVEADIAGLDLATADFDVALFSRSL
jgi:ubiquinone/menaquinone biosynthesis C-methylase UbiE